MKTREDERVSKCGEADWQLCGCAHLKSVLINLKVHQLSCVNSSSNVYFSKPRQRPDVNLAQPPESWSGAAETAVKSTYCPHRGHGFSSQLPHAGSQSSKISVPGEFSIFFWTLWALDIHVPHINSYRQTYAK